MSQEVKIPEMGESITSGILAAWLKEDGEGVSEGEDLFELETDKATVAVPAPYSGVLHTRVEADSEVEVGQVVAVIDEQAAGKEAAGKEAAGKEAAGEQKKAPEKGPEPETGREKEEAERERPRLSPAVRRIVEENDLDPAAVEGTGKDGRLTKEDALKAAREAKSKESPQRPGPAQAEQPAAPRPPQPPGERRRERVKMTPIRRRIAERLVQAKQGTAHLTTFNEIDMQRVADIRSRYKEAFERRHGVRLGFTSFFVKASCQALAAFPAVNAMIDGEEIVYNHFTDIGVAVSTDRGLIVPIIRDADRKSFAEIETEVSGFVARAKEKKITVDELTGGTFSITNGGVFGSLLSTPIPNPPQTAILGMHAIQKRPVVVDDQIVVRPMMYVALTYDHRLIDGREAVRFLYRIKEFVEDPNQMLLDL